MHRELATPYFQELDARIKELGGIFNAHLHLDRAGTYHETVRLLAEAGKSDGTALPLSGKHALIPMIHASSLYQPLNLEERVASFIELMIGAGTSRADTVVDVTDDGLGTRGMDVLLGLKERYRNQIDFRCGAYNPLGFRDDQPRRWELLVEAAREADFIGLLPERDDRDMYPEHIGFKESCRRGIGLAHAMDKKIHVHVDQANHSHETGTELVVDLVREMGLGIPAAEEPFIWLIHVISPSTYDEARFAKMVEGLSELNIGVICCPSAAISMRQYRAFNSPTFNSIARVLELLSGGVQVRLGSDNICDVTSPMGTADLRDELLVLANAVRFYDIDVIAKLAVGIQLDAADIGRIKAHLATDAQFVEAVVSRYEGD